MHGEAFESFLHAQGKSFVFLATSECPSSPSQNPCQTRYFPFDICAVNLDALKLMVGKICKLNKETYLKVEQGNIFANPLPLLLSPQLCCRRPDKHQAVVARFVLNCLQLLYRPFLSKADKPACMLVRSVFLDQAFVFGSSTDESPQDAIPPWSCRPRGICPRGHGRLSMI